MTLYFAGAKLRRGHPKGGLGPLGSSDPHMTDVAPPPPQGEGSELPQAASSKYSSLNYIGLVES